MKNIVYLCLLLCLSPYPVQGRAETLRVAVAANFSATLALIKHRFEESFPHKIVVIRGSTGKLYAQIRHGAPFDVFMAADVARPLRLEQDHLITDHSRYTYAIGRLALWWPKKSPAADGSANPSEAIRQGLLEGRFNKLAIANPKTAPYGRAALEVLQYLHVYEQCRPKLVYGENIAQAYQFVESGSAALGFVALSYVKGSSADYWLPPAEAYTKLEQQLVILAASKNQALAQRFADFMRRDDIKSIIKAQGYQTL